IIRENSAEILQDKQRLLRILTSLHRLPYLYYFYVPLFACSVELIATCPDSLVPFTKNIISYVLNNYYFSCKNLNYCISTNRILFMLEVNDLLNLLFESIADNKK